MAQNVHLFYFDCVINEAVSVIGRRTEEQKRTDDFGTILDALVERIPPTSITWVARESEPLFQEVLDLCCAHAGRLNVHDALMALFCRNHELRFLVSFDRDFDELPWLQRIAEPSQVEALIHTETSK